MEFIIRRSDIENREFAFVCSDNEYKGVVRVAGYVCKDFERVFGETPISVNCTDETNSQVIFGTIGRSTVIDKLIEDGAVDVSSIEGKRECYGFICENKDGKNRLYIVGSDKRGTIYGLFRLSELIGVSPFVNWCDVFPKSCDEKVIKEEDMIFSKEPSVRYRGFFINDEWPAFGEWVNHHFGGFNAKAYENIFELLLRLKGNYLWPAMWSSIFSNDGPGLDNAALADEMGVVMGLSHHEPCLRHGEEYKYLRGKDSIYGDAWDFRKNKDGITRFWEDGLKRSGGFENVITVGMRGEADSTILGKEATLKDNIDLLRDVLQTQNRLIKEYVSEDIMSVPRMLALYKEVEPFFYGDAGTKGLMDSPELEGVTLMLCDDNHGNLRTLPTEHMKTHNGGYGMYYHFDYHGGPVSFEWVNSSSLYKTWEQMTTAYEAGIRDLWIVNVGDVFTNEYPLSFFLDLAYDYDKWGISNIDSVKEYNTLFAEKLFAAGSDDNFSKEAARLLEGYTKISHSRRPESVNDNVYAPMSFGERRQLKEKCEELMNRATVLRRECPEQLKMPFYEFVYYPLMANLNIQCMWLDTTYNHYLAEIGASMAMIVADKVNICIDRDKKLVDELHSIYGGKWYGMGLSEHVGFRFWNEEECKYPVIHTFKPSNKARIVAVIPETGDHSEGGVWTKKKLRIPDFLRYDTNEAHIELYSTSRQDASFEVTAVSEGIKVMPSKGIVEGEGLSTLTVKLDLSKIGGGQSGNIHIHGEYMEIDIEVPYPTERDARYKKNTFIFEEDYISIEAGHYADIQDSADGRFVELENFGKTVSGIKAFPVEKTYLPGINAPCLTYNFVTKDEGKYTVRAYIAPSNPPQSDYKLNYGIAVNKGEIKVINAIPDDFGIYDGNSSWEYGPLNNIRLSEFEIQCKQGMNCLDIYADSPGFVLEKIVIYKDGKQPAYAFYGPKETYYTK